VTIDDALPGRILLVTDSAADGAALAAGFLDVHLVSPDELVGALDAESFPCVGISVLRTDGALAQVVRDLQAHAPGDITLLLEASDRAGIPGLAKDPGALEGLALQGVEVVAGLPCLVLRPDPGAEAPDLSLLVDYLGSVVAARESAGLHVLTGELGESAEHPRGEEVGGAGFDGNATSVGGAERQARGRSGRAELVRRARHAALLAAAVLAVLGAQLVVGLMLSQVADERDAATIAVAVALMVPVSLCLTYVIRGQRRFARGLSRLSGDVKRAGAAARRSDEREREALEDLATRVEALARKLEVVEVSAVDSARSLAALSRRTRQQV